MPAASFIPRRSLVAALAGLAGLAATAAAGAQQPAAASPLRRPPLRQACLPAAPSRANPAGRWPHTVTGANGSATIYQPQVISWNEHRTLSTRTAIGITTAGASAPILGVVEVTFATPHRLAERIVILSDPQLVSAKFPSVDATRAAQFEARIREALRGHG